MSGLRMGWYLRRQETVGVHSMNNNGTRSSLHRVYADKYPHRSAARVWPLLQILQLLFLSALLFAIPHAHASTTTDTWCCAPRSRRILSQIADVGVFQDSA